MNIVLHIGAAILLSSCVEEKLELAINDVSPGVSYPSDPPGYDLLFSSIGKEKLSSVKYHRIKLLVDPTVDSKKISVGVFTVSPCIQPAGYKYAFVGVTDFEYDDKSRISKIVLYVSSDINSLPYRSPDGVGKIGWPLEIASSRQCIEVDLKTSGLSTLYRGSAKIDNLF
ncbi:hypothetical protein [Acuticoccus kandeliae]|uniref:hypothetical protein n=1 Tax=Acuticoccus kandeliae TaxID=2073160 RepID=UPI0013003F89|nr:hypothetical protein [Acuticoccus kandeliae]